MAIIFSNNKSLAEINGKISVPGRIIQTVHTQSTATLTTSSTSFVDFFTSNSITLTNASNKILVEFHSDNRHYDSGDGVWNLYYIDIVHVQSGSQITYSGYRGQYTFNIAYYDKSVIHTPGSVGPHSYKMRGAVFNASYGVTYNRSDHRGHDGIAYIRLSEIAV